VVTYLFTAILCGDTITSCVYASIASYSVFNAFSRCMWFKIWAAQNNERQSLFDKGLVNTEKWGPVPKKDFLNKRWTQSSIRP